MTSGYIKCLVFKSQARYFDLNRVDGGTQALNPNALGHSLNHLFWSVKLRKKALLLRERPRGSRRDPRDPLVSPGSGLPHALEF